jgi:Protein of unknown function (DUF2997)
MAKRIEIVVGKGGKVRIEAHDYIGTGCEPATRHYTRLLRISPKTEEQKLEYFERASGTPETESRQ